MSDHASIFEAFLQRKHLKLTQPRRLILDTVFGLHEHFDTESLYALIRQISKDVSRATVYRTLPLLEEAGLIRRSVRAESREMFEHIYGHPRHAHWVCKICGAVTETAMQEVSKLVKKAAQATGFLADDVHLVVYGICWKCQQNENESQ